MINKLIIDGENVELTETTKMPYTHTFQQAKTHVVKFGLDKTNEVCAYAFKDCANLTKIEIPETITMLKRGAFMNCSSLPAITLNKNINYIGNHCFDGCTKLSEIVFEGDENRTVPEVYCEIPRQTTIYVPDDSKYETVEFDDIDPSGDIDYFTKTKWNQYVRVEDLSMITSSTQYYRNKWDTVGDNAKVKENKNRRPVEKITFANTTYGSNVGKFETVSVTITPTDCTNLNLTWESTDTTKMTYELIPNNPTTVDVHMLATDQSGNVKLRCYGESGINSAITFLIRPEKIKDVAFSVAPGEYTEAKTVAITCPTSGVTIYYTTNGNNPSERSTKYTEPIELTTTTTLKAIATKENMTNSDIATAEYVINIPESEG